MWKKLFGLSSGHTTDAPETIRQNIADGNAIMLDVRSQQERDAGFLSGSIFIPITEIKAIPPGTAPGTDSLMQLPVDKIVYCH